MIAQMHLIVTLYVYCLSCLLSFVLSHAAKLWNELHKQMLLIQVLWLRTSCWAHRSIRLPVPAPEDGPRFWNVFLSEYKTMD